MRWRWLRKKAKRDRSKDFNRHYRVVQRIQMRLEEAAERGDLARVKVLFGRIKHVRDIQISDVGY